MDNSQLPAYPVIRIDEDGHPYSDQRDAGITKLERFTMAAMQGLLSQNDIHLMQKVANKKGVSSEIALANTAIEVAKATLSELSKHQ